MAFKRALKKIWNYLYENWGNFITILFPILISIDKIKNFLDDHYLRWVFGVILFLIASVQSVRSFTSKKELNERLARLENENSMLKSNLEAVPLDMIRILAKQFKFENDDRVTLYRVTPEETFIPVARFSESPVYRKFGRKFYPSDSGYIGECWLNGEVKKEKLADYYNGDASRKRYIEQALKQGGSLTKEDVEGLQMKCRSIYGKRLHYNGDAPIAIIVIESMKTSLPMNTDDIKKFLDGPFGKVLIDTIEKNKPIGLESEL